MARNPGKDACFLIEGRRCDYHRVAEKDVYKLYTEFKPAPVGDVVPHWWLAHIPAFTTGHKPVEIRKGSREWNGWYGTEIDDKFYIFPSYAIRKHFHEGTRQWGPMRKMTRLVSRPDLV